MLKEHGTPEIEKTKGQIAITTKDIEKIPDIINNYDTIIQGTDNKQGKTIRYIKNYSNNQSYVIVIILLVQRPRREATQVLPHLVTVYHKIQRISKMIRIISHLFLMQNNLRVILLQILDVG